MVRIRQHGESDALYDLRSFVEDLEFVRRVLDYWTVRFDEVYCKAAPALEELTSNSPRLSPRAFEGLCDLIEQTIDGEFVAYRGDREVLRLVAVDSSYWEISGPPEFEDAMLRKYGAYKS
jgi:hypothetical protein